ncbi:hypothetical protein FJTKL_13061 [Diaporthe vaccinii]|uniref:Ubiquitin-like protease family profile domain-containing protein n=1 Tax=Diaporthe vaccinii TaxID=105482 RepID=A0ABR4EC72_9PEZI
MNYEDVAGALPNSDEAFQVTLKTLDVFDPDFFRRIGGRQFTLWLINTGGHWASIVLHVQGCQVVDYAINDSERRSVLINLVDKRLRRLLAIGGITIVPAQHQIKDIWFPTQLDGFTCGLRTYEILRVVIERINERYHLHGVNNLYDDSLWAAMSGDFQPSKVRQLMMGIVACRAMKHQDYKARLSVTPREKIRGFKGPRRQGVAPRGPHQMRTKICRMLPIYQERSQREQRARQHLVRTSDFRGELSGRIRRTKGTNCHLVLVSSSLVFNYRWNGGVVVCI